MENPSHPSTYLLLHVDNSSNHISHEISLIHLSLNLRLEESSDLINLVVEVKKSSIIYDRDGSYSMSSGLTETSTNNYPQTMHDLVQASKCNYTILGISKTFQGVEALQISLMVMLGSRNSCKPPKLSQIWFLSHNLSLCMVSLDVNFLMKNVRYSQRYLSNFQDFTSDKIQEFVIVHSSSCKSLTSNLGWESSSLIESWNCEFDHSGEYLFLKE